MPQGFSTKLVLGIAALLLIPSIASAGNDLATINGRVHDSTGFPITGALVIVAAASPIIPERVALTGKDGSFSIPNLFAGQYSVKISMPQFLPALTQGIQLNAGGTVVLTVNLQNAMDVVRGVSRQQGKSDDMVWTLRSSRSTQPVLRLADSTQKTEGPAKSALGPDYSGYLQVYSKSVETSSSVTQGVGSQFSLTVPVDVNSQITVHGQYNGAPMQPRGFGASYEFVPASHHKAEIGMNLRQGALFGDPLESDASREVQVRYGENFQWSDHFVFHYRAEAGRAGVVSGTTYLRPRFDGSWGPDVRTTVTVGMSSQAPTSQDDPIRGKEYFDRALYVPPALERYSHSEAGLTWIPFDNTEGSAAVSRDPLGTPAALRGSPDGRPKGLILDNNGMPSHGNRGHANRQFRNFEAGIGFSSVNGGGMDAKTPKRVGNQLTPRRFPKAKDPFK